jgi:hypothetical protein
MGESIEMGKRKMINFARPGADQYEDVEEEGMPKPCAMGIPWVNPDTLSTLEQRKIIRTGPKGEPLAEQKES